MAKVLHEIDHGRESTHLMLSPSLRPCPSWRIVIADQIELVPGMSALDLTQ